MFDARIVCSSSSGSRTRKKLLLYFEVFFYDFDDEVALARGSEVVLEVTDGDALAIALREERSRLALQRFVERARGERVALGWLRRRRRAVFRGRNDVEEQHFEARAREVSRDSGAHDAGAEHRYFSKVLHC